MGSRKIKANDSNQIRISNSAQYPGAFQTFSAELLPKLITVAQAANKAHYSERTIRRKLKNREILGCRLHGKWFVVWPLELVSLYTSGLRAKRTHERDPTDQK